jgi:hypothetical protein
VGFDSENFSLLTCWRLQADIPASVVNGLVTEAPFPSFFTVDAANQYQSE